MVILLKKHLVSQAVKHSSCLSALDMGRCCYGALHMGGDSHASA